ncbi:MAG TPA: T9SS type A sorting domain-containing protein [Edaphocola sp.]|nr:T9SS type A sorting domain-containing protein [Edaphocola sp.]
MKLLYKIFLLILLGAGISTFEVQAQSLEQQRFTNTIEKRVYAYPNPANNIVSIKLSSGLKSDAKTVDLISVIGRTVASQKVSTYENEDLVFTNLNQLPEGIYIVTVKNAEGKILQSTKLMIQR